MDQEWYFCLEHGTVEPREGCSILDRMGPYPTKEEAARALETSKQRNQAWENDPRFQED